MKENEIKHRIIMPSKIKGFLYRFKFYRRFKAWLSRQEDKSCDCGAESYEIDPNLVIEQKNQETGKAKKRSEL